MAKNNKGTFHYNNTDKTNKNFMYNNLTRANCYNSNFSGANFNFVSFRGAHFKSCDFFGCTFKSAEFIGTNLKNSKFRQAKFEDAIFEEVNLDNVDFRDAEFKNTYFVGCDLSSCNNFNLSEEIVIFESMPSLEIDIELKEAIDLALKNQYVKKSRTLDLKDGTINPIKVQFLMKKFGEENLVNGFKKIAEEIDRDFHTVSYLFKYFQ